MKYKVLTLWEPWATLLVHGEKKIETRPAKTNFLSKEGTYLIHAAAKYDQWQRDLIRKEPFKTSFQRIFERHLHVIPLLQPGHIIGSIEVTNCFPTYVNNGLGMPAYGNHN